VVVTYYDHGGYNHPDHLQAHRITVAAVERTGIPAKLYFIARRRRDFQRLRETMRAHGFEPPERPAPDQARMAQLEQQMELAERRITTSVDIRAVIEAKRAALRAHASQLDESWWSHIPADLFADIFGEETFIRARDASGAPVPEDDLFAGLR
jgi:LmbE family N-acetylglucosaminyl deacetylase